ncbi:protein-lysine N-methyltransferase NDAI_0F01610 [Naumovozyma dairenensis CBS 421]|uniref:SET domain-containing protein n=1 Tax=Naumovozyma dairenensis (strain ATCC 10597 / BCRC 20456 / CBS 421 / NBRC 0211 / NRRL Y-12639) TaxID=1071378 RepID=G0WCG9_NAUDC|nr:hypothetical protein NDAI_0F01610 [Naumovozyma dairenensis CBS 421]CCD25480.1 hypothetical protein NDAI_0F01610 [Naumovozyma dairenensis CBS 421]
MALENLLTWGEKYGVNIPDGLKFQHDEKKGFYCIATKDVTNPTIEIPQTLIISGKLSRDVFADIETNDENNNSWLKLLFAKLKFDNKATYLSTEEGNDKNEPLNLKFKPYIDALPKIVDSPYLWTPNELKLLKGTNLYNSLFGKLHTIFKEWYNLINKMNERESSNFQVDFTLVEGELKIYDNWSNIDFHNNYHEFYNKIILETVEQRPKCWYSFSSFLWSHLIFISRAFPEYVIDNTRSPSNVVLLPIIDLMNHDYNAKVQWSSTNGGFTYNYIGGTIAENKELFNNYGAKGNEELLTGYGFVLEDNMYDLVLLKIKPPLKVISDILQNEPNLELPTLDDYTTFAFEQDFTKGKDHDEEDDHNDISSYKDGIIYVVNPNVNKDYLEPLWNIFTYLSKKKFEKMTDLRPRLEGLQSLRNALEHKLEGLEDTQETNLSEQICFVNPYRRYCATIYREGQIRILKRGILDLRNEEKNVIHEKKRFLLNFGKITKHDFDFTERELPQLLQDREDEEEMVFDSTFELLVLWVLLKVLNKSFIPKHEWVGDQYKVFLSEEDKCLSPEEGKEIYRSFLAIRGIRR